MLLLDINEKIASYPIAMFVVDSCLMPNASCTRTMIFALTTIRFPYDLKKLFDRILRELQYLPET